MKLRNAHIASGVVENWPETSKIHIISSVYDEYICWQCVLGYGSELGIWIHALSHGGQNIVKNLYLNFF